MQIVSPPIPVFVDTNGQSLDAGYIYIGTVNQNPELSPIAVYWDDALTQPAAQPIRTIGGMPARNGTPSNIYTASAYSISVKTKAGALVCYIADSGLTSALSSLADSTNFAKGDALVAFKQPFAGAVAGTVHDKLSRYVDVKDFGAVGDGVTNDFAAITAAIAAVASTGGGHVYLPPTGHGYYVATGLSLPNGVCLIGDKTWTYPGSTAPLTTWTQFGSWVISGDTVNPALTLSGHGTGVVGVAFGYAQPAPGGTYTPTIYPFAIDSVGSFTTIRDVFVFAATHGIRYNYTSLNGGGTNNILERALIDACKIGIQTHNVNDVMRWDGVDIRPMYYNSNTVMQNYHEANKIGWDCYYCDNPQIDSLQIFQASVGVKFTDETCLGTTHSLWHGQLDNLQLTFCNNALLVAASTTHLQANFDGLFTQSDTGAFGTTLQSGTLLELNSDNVGIIANNVQMTAGGVAIELGGGTGGTATLSAMRIDSYAAVSAGQTAVVVNGGAVVNLDGYDIVKVAGNGVRFGGANSSNGLKTSASQVRDFYSNFGVASFSASGAFADISTGRLETPASLGLTQARIVGNVNVTVAAGATMSLQMSGATTVSATGIPTNSTGFKNYDSGWVDLLTSALSTPLGRLQANITAGATVSNGEMQLQLR